MAGGCEELIGREADAVTAGLARAYRRALADNPEGAAHIAEAVRGAIVLGVEAGCARAGTPAAELDCGADAWELWQARRDLTPEGRVWPSDLGPEVLERARQRVADAGADLGLHGRAERSLRHVGEQAAEAGAALVRAMTEPAAAPVAAATATAAPVGDLQPDRTVRVAVASNQAEAELLQGVLEDAGIPSTWRRTGGDLPELLAAGYREIYVPAKAAEEAQVLLATLETPDAGDEEGAAPTRRVGLERTALRLVGKATIVIVTAGIVLGLVVGVAADEPALGLAVLVATLVAGVAVVVWSERAGRA
jgi:hypothetical protein